MQKTFIIKLGILLLRRRIGKLKEAHTRESLRIELEFRKKELKIQRLAEDNKAAMKRAREDWALESAFIQDQIDALEDQLLGEICLVDAQAAKKARHAANYGASTHKTLEVVGAKDAS